MTLPIYLTAETALEAFRGYIAQVLSITAIRASQPFAEAARPTLPYVTVQRTHGADLSLAHRRVGDELDTPQGEEDELTHELDITRMREIYVQVAFYGDEGPELAEILPSTVHRLSAREYLNAEGIQIRPIGEILDTLTLRDTVNEASAMQEYAVLYCLQDLSAIGTIETVTSDITGSSEDYDVAVP